MKPSSATEAPKTCDASSSLVAMEDRTTQTSLAEEEAADAIGTGTLGITAGTGPVNTSGRLAHLTGPKKVEETKSREGPSEL